MCWQGCGEIEILTMHCWWKYKIMQPLRKTGKAGNQTDTCITTFTEAFSPEPKGPQCAHQYLSTGEQTKCGIYRQ